MINTCGCGPSIQCSACDCGIREQLTAMMAILQSVDMKTSLILAPNTNLSGTIVVNFVNIATGAQIINPLTLTGIAGQTANVQAPTLPGYMLVSPTPLNPEFPPTGQSTNLTFTYTSVAQS